MPDTTDDPTAPLRPSPDAPLLAVRDLSVTFGRRGQEPLEAVSQVSFTVRPGEHVGLVGESGSGKSVTSLAIMGLLPAAGVRVEGVVSYRDQDLLTMRSKARAGLRGREIAMVFQDPMSSLNPVVTVGRQIAEVVERHRGLKKADALDQAVDLLRTVGIPDAGRRIKEYPHQLSGGMRQRVLIAIALACEPRLLIADEPTTALDVTIQAQILELLRELVADTGTALILITHDLGVVAGLCDQVHVMYSGRIVESAPRRPLFAAPAHPYTGGLLASIPRLDTARDEPLRPIPGSPTDTLAWSQGCAFAPRCANVLDRCRESTPRLESHGDRALRCFNPLSTTASKVDR
ncbi:MAG: ABC transporter ATP-binding protein [Actinomycetota bacterium]|nr:ABC transporter ATP-binding protein [Actinomycetota bacterium]